MLRSALMGLALVVLSSATAFSEVPRKITWKDLVPKDQSLEDPYADVNGEQTIELGIIQNVRIRKEKGLIRDGDPNLSFAADYVKKLAAQGLDVETLLAKDRIFRAKKAKLSRQLVGDLKGQMVTMPGFALPLEFTDQAVKEFLLVPYVGACIHSPAPPANQIVFVTLREGYKIENIFQPVMITGRMSVTSSTQKLSYVDGQANINAGYTLDGLFVVPYDD